MESNNDNVSGAHDLETVRRHKLAKRRAQGDAYPNNFTPSHSLAELVEQHSDKNREQLAEAKTQAHIAGRIVLQRPMGKAIFLTIQSGGERMQIYANRQTLQSPDLSEAGQWDIGDIIGANGELFKTRAGELTLRATTMHLLVKSLQPPADKFHGLADMDTRYRRRYVSLIANPQEYNTFVMRANITRYIRDFFHTRHYLELETPMLQPIPGGAMARPFITHCNALGCDFYLRIAQELYIKRLLVGGFERVFEINRIFRNEGVSTRHNPEFTMLEFNAAYHNCEDFIQLTEELLHRLVVDLTGGDTIDYQGQRLSFARPFARTSPTAAILQQCPQYTLDNIQDENFLRARLDELNLPAKDLARMSLGEMQLAMFESVAENQLMQPTFLIDYPAAASPLAKRNPQKPNIAERFELFVAGRELVNGFSELNDPDAQDAIFQEQANQKDSGDNEAMHYDADYILALQYGLPPNAGGGIGIDRLVMLLTDSPSIRQVILFPQLKPDNSAK